MREYVFKRSRLVNGKRVYARYFSGVYTLAKGEKPVSVPLHTPSERVAKKMLRALIERKQMEREGMLAPEAMRSAASVSLTDLVTEYEADLRGRGLAPSHVRETVARIRRVVGGARWARLGDVTAVSYVSWRSRFEGAAKTKKEYQTSVKAFLNWLLRLGRIAVNPLAGVDRVETRGKAARLSRSYTPAEVSKLLSVASDSRRIVYQFLVSTGLRKKELKTLRWESVDLVNGVAKITGKGGRTRVVPLRPELVELLGAVRPLTWSGPSGLNSPAHKLLFSPFPSDDVLHADLKRAGIDRKDASGRVVHWHAFRKTFMTWGASSGVGQRSLQAVLGHSTPVLSANVYTDVEALPLRAEVSKLPWITFGDASAVLTPPAVKGADNSRFRALLAELLEVSKTVVPEVETAVSGASSLAARHGFEP
jgi:integrase